MRRRTLFLLLFLIYSTSYFQSSAEDVAIEVAGTIVGIIKDKTSGQGIEYATIALYKQDDQSVVTGAVTNIDGEFRIGRVGTGIYYAEISFLGYDNKVIKNIEIGTGKHHVDLGIIILDPSAKALNEIEVVGEKKSFDYQIDKKVINVGKQYSSASMTAVEVLENVPSVKVDIEGNVSLRGSTGFTVLIDGKPSILDPSDALQQIPANTIESIEIITNPSAKYRPDGTAGIINVITKDNKMLGWNGQATLHAGMFERKGSELIMNYRTPKVNFLLGADYNTNKHPGKSSTESITRTDSIDNYLISDGQSDRQRERWSINGGIEVDLTPKDIFSIGGRYGYRKGSNSGEVNYRSFTSDFDEENDSSYTSFEDRFRGGNFYSITGTYQHKFNKEGHNLDFQFDYGERSGDEETKNELINENGDASEGRINYESGPGHRTQIRLDYTLPFSETNKLEAGYQGRYSYGEDNTALDTLDITIGEYVRLPIYNNSTIYEDDITGLYGIYSGTINSFGYQLGIRSEYTGRVITSSSSNHNFIIDDWDFFPTVHLSYQFPNNHQMMASYSRRIERPRGWQLEPFLTWQDAYNVRQGNPELQSEYIDSYEFGFLKEMESSFISVEAYYRKTHNKIEFIRSVYDYDKNIILRQPFNVGDDYAFGLEGSFNFTKLSWWELNLMGDLYNYKMEGSYDNKTFSNESFNWGARWNNIFKLPLKSQLQFNMNYNSPSVTAQGKEEGEIEFNSAYRIDLFKRKVSAIIQVRDLFATAKHESTTKDNDFYYHSKYTRKSPFVTFSISYRLNNFKPKREERQNGGQSNDDMGGDDF